MLCHCGAEVATYHRACIDDAINQLEDEIHAISIEIKNGVDEERLSELNDLQADFKYALGAMKTERGILH